MPQMKQLPTPEEALLNRRDGNYRRLRGVLSGVEQIGIMPALIREMFKVEPWKGRKTALGNMLPEVDLERFIHDPPPEGLGATYAEIERWIRDDPATLTLWTKATKRQPGRPKDNVQGLRPEHPSGNSRERALRQLDSLAAEDESARTALQAVLAGDLSPHAALVGLGKRKPAITLPLDVEAAAATIRRRFTPEQVAEVAGLLGDAPPQEAEQPAEQGASLEQAWTQASPAERGDFMEKFIPTHAYDVAGAWQLKQRRGLAGSGGATIDCGPISIMYHSIRRPPLGIGELPRGQWHELVNAWRQATQYELPNLIRQLGRFLEEVEDFRVWEQHPDVASFLRKELRVEPIADDGLMLLDGEGPVLIVRAPEVRAEVRATAEELLTMAYLERAIEHMPPEHIPVLVPQLQARHGRWIEACEQDEASRLERERRLAELQRVRPRRPSAAEAVALASLSAEQRAELEAEIDEQAMRLQPERYAFRRLLLRHDLPWDQAINRYAQREARLGREKLNPELYEDR